MYYNGKGNNNAAKNKPASLFIFGKWSIFTLLVDLFEAFGGFVGVYRFFAAKREAHLAGSKDNLARTHFLNFVDFDV
ncbi:hypothetical protein QQ965_01265 [Candidatus Saccharibacteria bacterium oral taxon 955]